LKLDQALAAIPFAPSPSAALRTGLSKRRQHSEELRLTFALLSSAAHRSGWNPMNQQIDPGTAHHA
jgi:hypothetical protein